MRIVFAAVATATLALSACGSSPDPAAQAAPSHEDERTALVLREERRGVAGVYG